MIEPSWSSRVYLRVEKIKRLMRRDGLSANALALKARMNAKTLSRGMNGQRVDLDSVKKLAAVFAISDCTDLIRTIAARADRDTALHLLANPEPTNTAHLILKVPVSMVQEPDDFQAVLDRVADIIEQKGVSVLLEITEGSIRLSVLFSDERDIESLILSFCTFRLLPLAIEDLEVSSFIDFASLWSRLPPDRSHSTDDVSTLIQGPEGYANCWRDIASLRGLHRVRISIHPRMGLQPPEMFFQSLWMAFVSSQRQHGSA